MPALETPGIAPQDEARFVGESFKHVETVSLSVVVPVKDEAGNAAKLAREIAAALKDEGAFEIVFVDDGSSDGTAQELLALRPELPLRILVHARNLGQSRALRTGVRAARAELIVTLDGDGQNDPDGHPETDPRLPSRGGESESLGMIAGERVGRKDTWSKRAASRFGNGVRRAMLGDKRERYGLQPEAVPARRVLGAPLFRSHAPLSHRAHPARRL